MRDAVLGTRITGVEMGNGTFSLLDNEIFPSHMNSTVLVCFKTSKTIRGQVIYQENLAHADMFGSFFGIAMNGLFRCCVNNVMAPMTGTMLAKQDQVCFMAVSCRNGETAYECYFNINGKASSLQDDGFGRDYDGIVLGGQFDGELISCRRFDFAMTPEQLAEAWNNGHPELWSVPYKYRNGAEGARCMLDLSPASLTPTVWYDLSGQGNDVPYVPSEGQPAEATLVTDTVAIASLTDVEREELLAYARRYDADRAAVLLRQANLTATAELEEHESDAVVHITSEERSAWNAKETPTGAQTKTDAALKVAKQYADTTEDNAVRDAVLGTRWTGAIVGGNKGGFKSQSPALILPDQPTTLIVCFRLPKSDTAIVYDVNTTSANVTSYGEYIFVQQGNFVRVSMRGVAGSAKSITGTDLCMAALSYTPDKPLLTRINESVEVSAGVPEYKNPYTPQHVRLGGWSSSYTEMQIISVRRFDFAMTEEQLAEAWNGGHPELWSVPDKYRNGAEGARCFLDLNPASLTPTVWYDQSGQGNDIPYVTYAGQPAEATLVTDTTAIASLTDVDREALLAYACQYDADREAVLLRQADLVATAELEEHVDDKECHLTDLERQNWDSAIQSAKIGDKDVPKSGTTLQLPAYPHVPQMDSMQATAPDIPHRDTTIYHTIFGNMLFVSGAFTGSGQEVITGMFIPVSGFDRMIMGQSFNGAIVVDSGTRDAENVYTTTISTTTINGKFGLSIDWGVGLMLNGVTVVLMPILIPLASQPWDV